jgi:hypothetical protein
MANIDAHEPNPSILSKRTPCPIPYLRIDLPGLRNDPRRDDRPLGGPSTRSTLRSPLKGVVSENGKNRSPIIDSLGYHPHMASTWDPKHEAELDRLLVVRQPQEAAKVAALSPEDRARYQGFIGATCDVITINWVYIRGFENITKCDPTGIPSHVLHWGHQKDGRSPRRLAGMIATHLCSTLEEFIGQAANPLLTSDFIRKLPRSYVAGLKSKARDSREIKKAILRSIKPSTRSDGKEWVFAIQTVFSVRLDAATEETLLSMIRFRNEYVHAPGNVMKDDFTAVNVIESISWMKAVLLLAYDMTLGH